jgi:hypothetical protein
MQAYDDFDAALSCREMARKWKSYRLPGWRMDHKMELRRAIRAWKHYKDAVKKAGEWRAAA